MTENSDEGEIEKTSPPNNKIKIAVAIIALLCLIILAAVILRRAPQPQNNRAGREVPSVESVAGREVPSVESTRENSTPTSGKADLTFAPEMLARINLQYAEVKSQNISNQLRTTGTVQANSYKETRVMPLVGGRVLAVKAELGNFVKKGQPLATIYSTELAQEQTEYLKVEANLDLHISQSERYRKLAEIGAVSKQELQEVEVKLHEHHAEHASHRQKLKLLGMTDAQIEALKNNADVRSEVVVPAPSSGIITARGVNIGQVVAVTDSLFSVTDLSTVWVIGNVFEKDFGAMRMGAKVIVSSPSYAGRQFNGTISYIDPRIDPASRTAQIRIEVPNPNQVLKIGMFVDMALNIAGQQDAIAIPKAALQQIGNEQVVFVALGSGQFQMRKLQLGEDLGNMVRVTSGIMTGEKIVTEGSFFLRAEIGRRGN